MRNSLLLAPMFMASTDNNEGFEPYISNIYTRRAGELEIVCPPPSSRGMAAVAVKALNRYGVNGNDRTHVVKN